MKEESSAVFERGEVEAEDGWRLGFRVWAPAEPRAGLLFFPPMGASTRSLGDMAAALAARGVAVMLADPRGIGLSLPRPSRSVDFSMWDHLEQDWPAFIAEARRRFGPETRLVIGGHSLGGQLSALYLGLRPGAADGLLSIAACALWYRHWARLERYGILAFYQLFWLVSQLWGYLPGQHLGWGRPCAKTLTKEWSVWGRKGRYTRRDGSSAEELFAGFRGEALVVSFSDDTRYAPKPAVDALARRLEGGRVERWHLDPAELGQEAIGHFGLRRCPELWRRVADWILATKEGS